MMHDYTRSTFPSMCSPRHSRRTIVRNALGLTATIGLAGVIPVLDRQPAIARGTASETTVEEFYFALATYRYEDAYALLGPDLQAKQSLDDFIEGYADTAYVEAQITGSAAEGDHDDIQVTIMSWHNDRSIHAYHGTYTLQPVDDGWDVVDSAIVENDPPQDVVPLMRFSDLDLSLGSGTAGLGHRYSNLLVTNTSGSTVLAAGVPQLTLLDGNGDVVLESSASSMQPVTAVPIAAGESANAPFEWSNWCEDSPVFPLDLQIAIPGDTSRQTIPFRDGPDEGAPPPCIGSAEGTIFQAQAFQPQT